jgi:hypothetical protein
MNDPWKTIYVMPKKKTKMKNTLRYKVNEISFVKLLKNHYIKGIQTGMNTMTCKKKSNLDY